MLVVVVLVVDQIHLVKDLMVVLAVVEMEHNILLVLLQVDHLTLVVVEVVVLHHQIIMVKVDQVVRVLLS